MPETTCLTLYLAGPVTNCNEKQKTEWRKAIKVKLATLGHKWIDPAEHDDWTPLKEMVELDRSDVVIANLWRVSVGTVIGIVQARRKGKPVILIDPNYMENLVLRHLVGKEFIVNGMDAAVHLLPQVAEQLRKGVSVRKTSGALEPFSSVKLHDSINAVCARAHVEDAILPDIVANAVQRAILKYERNGEIHTDQIKSLVFDSLADIATDNLYEQELKTRAAVVRNAWQEYERGKKDQRWALQRILEVEQELNASAERITTLVGEAESYKSESDDLRRRLRECEREAKARTGGKPHSAAPAEDLRKDYANYFPNIRFADSVLDWLLSCDKVDKRTIESKFRLMNQEQLEGKHEVPGTDPLVWQHDAGHGLRIYFRLEANHRATIVRLGTKGTQEVRLLQLEEESGFRLIAVIPNGDGTELYPKTSQLPLEADLKIGFRNN